MADPGIDRFRDANTGLSALVSDELAGFFGALNLGKPEASRNALLEFVPLLVDQYGAVAESLALDWYDEQRASSSARGVFRATAPAGGIPKTAVESKVRYLAGALWTPEPEVMLSGLATSVDKYVKQPGRAVFPFNARREGARWARVPSGAKTCAFCLLLASRDAAYVSRQSASQGADGGRYHGLCDCTAVRIGPQDEYPPGYLPAESYEMYQTARDDAGSGNLNEIVASMRRLYPEYLTDGVHAH